MSVARTIISREPFNCRKRTRDGVIIAFRSFFIQLLILLAFAITCFVFLFFLTNTPHECRTASFNELEMQLQELESIVEEFKFKLPEEKQKFLSDEVSLVQSLAPSLRNSQGIGSSNLQYIKSTVSNCVEKLDNFLLENPQYKSYADHVYGKSNQVLGIANSLSG